MVWIYLLTPKSEPDLTVDLSKCGPSTPMKLAYDPSLEDDRTTLQQYKTLLVIAKKSLYMLAEIAELNDDNNTESYEHLALCSWTAQEGSSGTVPSVPRGRCRRDCCVQRKELVMLKKRYLSLSRLSIEFGLVSLFPKSAADLTVELSICAIDVTSKCGLYLAVRDTVEPAV